jgi:SET domain-containing protein
MILVKTKLGSSAAHGIGVFADQLIPKGTVISEFRPGFDQKFTPETVAQMPPPAVEYIDHYAYRSDVDGMFVLCFDNERFLNHSAQPNTESVSLPGNPEGGEIALRDIQPGEELLCDYRSFDLDSKKQQEEYLK